MAQTTSRRNFLAGTGVAALSLPSMGAQAATGKDCLSKADRAKLIAAAPKAPFDSIRDYMAALDAHGLVMRVPEIDQDEYQVTALMFRATDRYGFFRSPAFIYDKIKIDGDWIDGPLVGNFQGHVNTDCILFGLEPDPDDIKVSYRRAKAHMDKMLSSTVDGRWPKIAPVELSRNEAPCKEVTLTGDECDLNSFAFIKTNPADSARYVNTGSVFTSDPEMGNNFGTYRCEITGPRKLRINSEKNHAGYKMLLAARERGEKVGHVAVAVGQDPIVWLLSGAPMARQRGDGAVDELAIAGGLRGKALEVVKADNSDMLVPAHAEMIIEGEVPLDEPLENEGPFGEMFGYLGLEKVDVFWMNVTRITHRRNPWLMNSFTGMQRGFTTSPLEVMYERIMRRSIPSLIDFHYPQDMMGVSFVSIDKTAPGQGLEVGKIVANRVSICKVVVVVDKDLDVLDRTQMLFAMGSRWQPAMATEIIEKGIGTITDPSQIVRGETSKIVIDATMQWPEEGGPENYPKRNRVLLEELAPDALAQVDRLFGTRLKDWGNA
ncbi:MAG: UbiD family decarboxylase [Gammaproteobacteria bacterium]|nr:UbiD family decarboxylase [Gammaproteobacteria bacterium]MDP6695225.1 UbiD family decarboxylase [Gammaproteobacteria bacterium]